MLRALAGGARGLCTAAAGPAAAALARADTLRSLGCGLYRTRVFPTVSLARFRAQYDGAVATGSRDPDRIEVVCGRVLQRREQSSKLVFLDLVDGSQEHRLQVMCSRRDYDAGAQPPFEVLGVVRRGDIVAVRGFPARTRVGELSIVPLAIDVVAPCLRPLPETLEDPDTRYRQRYLDMLVNESTRSALRMRSSVIASLRHYLRANGFVEVETPVLGPIAGGATARPFETTSVALGPETPLQMRIAPELYLKQLVVGGMERVFEIGKQFRNEGLSTSHNIEFTSCELYMAYADYTFLMDLTEKLLLQIVEEVAQEPYLSVHLGEDWAVADFRPPFVRIAFLDALESRYGRGALPADVNDPAAVAPLLELCRSAGIACPAPHTNARVLDALFSPIEKDLIQPTFVTDFPVCMSPLAAGHRVPGLTERFELYVGGRELCNAYSELADPDEQRRRFERQSSDRTAGDDEIPPTDADFCTALEYGMPPTAGWGMGVDRLCAMLARAHTIKDVITFPIQRRR